MAFKRKRVYAPNGSSWGAKRRRTGFRKRRSYGRRRMGMGMRRRTSSSYGTQRGNVNTMGYTNNRLSRQAYKNRLWADSLMANHFRSYITFTNVTLTTPANGAAMNYNAIGLTTSAFWTTIGGLIGPGLFSQNDLYIRGGLSTFRFNNDGASDANITMFIIRTTLNGIPPPNATVDTMWDPTQVIDFEQNYRIIGRREFALATNETQTIKRKIRTQKLDQTIYAGGGNREYYIIAYTSPSGVSANVSLTAGFSLSFTGDSV